MTAPGSTWEDYIPIVPEMASMDEGTRSAFRYLESRGYRFLIHYGWKNAEDIARQVFMNEPSPYRC